MGPATKRKIFYHFIAFFFLGLAMGIIEDLIAIHFSTGAKITPHVFLIAFLVALPFSLVSEVLIDFELLRRLLFKNPEKKETSRQKAKEE